MARINTPLVFALEHRMSGNFHPILKDADIPRMVLDLQRASACCIRYAVKVAIDRDHAVLADPALHTEHSIIRQGR